MAYASAPIDDAVAVPDSRHPLAAKLPKLKMGRSWLRWTSGLTVEVDSKPSRQAQRNLSAQGASIANTSLPIGSVVPGVWRVSYTVRVTRAGSVSSSIQVTIRWTQGGVTQTEAGAALAGNLTTTREGATRVIRPDNATPISYSTVYADGGGATSMQYSLDLVAELVAADS